MVDVVSPLELRDLRAYWRGVRVKLTLREFAIVRCLALQSGGDVSYRQLYSVVRGKGFVAGEGVGEVVSYGTDGFRINVRSFIKSIRKRFCDVDPEFDEIENYPSFGYRWRGVAETDEVSGLGLYG